VDVANGNDRIDGLQRAVSAAPAQAVRNSDDRI